MDIFVFILCIVAISTIGGLVREKIKNDRQALKNVNPAAHEQRFQALEQRIQTLERIVTDQKTQLKDKIDAL